MQIAILFLVLSFYSASQAAQTATQVWLVVHGGTADRKKVPQSLEPEIQAGILAALKSGDAILRKGGSSLDAVEAAVIVLEDNPLFNAGKGAIYNRDGKHELEASIMEGSTLKAGAATGLSHIKNPVTLARIIMEKSPHVFLMGEAAEKFGKENGIAHVDNSHFDTERRYKDWQEVKKKENEAPSPGQWGTVGAVALDAKGHLAVATSTGGRVNKMVGRIGDTPIIGASTYADDSLCAISTTGHGEFFIRYVVAYDICAQMKYKKLTTATAIDAVIQDRLAKVKGHGGAILLDPKGNMAISYNTPGMPRGYATKDGKFSVDIFGTP